VYARASLFLVMLACGELAMYVLTLSGFLRSACLLSCLRLDANERMVFCALPEFLAFRRVFIMRSLYFVGWLGSSYSFPLVIPVANGLDWFSIPAWGVGDPGFKSQRPHHT